MNFLLKVMPAILDGGWKVGCHTYFWKWIISGQIFRRL